MFQEIKFYATNNISYEMIQWAYNKVCKPDCHYVIEIHYYCEDELDIYYIDGSKSPKEMYGHPFIATKNRCAYYAFDE